MAQDPLSRVAAWLAPARPDTPVDPVLALITERARLWAECELVAGEPGEEAFDARVDQTSKVTRALDERMVDMVAASPAGLIAQVELLVVATGKREQSARVGEPVDDDLVDPLAASIVAGIKVLTAPADDSRIILSLFREWVATTRTTVALYDGDGAEYEASAAAVYKIEDAIIEAPSTGAVGLAIKSYLLHHIEGAADDGGPALGDGAINWEIDASILKDVIRFVPELAPLAAGAFDSQPDEHRP
jgi:hypothetical protein